MPPRKKRKTGRPRIEFDLNQLRKLAALGCTEKEIAGFFECSVETITKRKQSDPEFLLHIEKGRAEGRMSLRRLQWKTARAGSAGMQIWLGKQLLGQRDYRDPPKAESAPQEKHTATLQDDGEGSSLDDA